MSYRAEVNEHLRITILRYLKDDPNYTINDSLLLDLVGEFGFAPSRDAMRTQLTWLHEQDLVTVKDVKGCMVATLTSRGLDVAQGRATVPGVRRPDPGSM